MNSYVLLFVLSFVVLASTAVYVWKRRQHIDEMHGMMVGMTFGMVAGLVAGTLYTLPTGNFMVGTIIASVIGLLFGVPFGRLGRHLGIVEGVMAGPMGGMMGAMLGQMLRPYNADFFMPFFTFIFLISMLGISYAVHCGVSCCSGNKKEPSEVSNTFVFLWSVACVVLIGASILLTFNIQQPSENAVPQQSDVTLPAYLQQVTAETRAEAVLRDGYQEVSMSIANSLYSPNVLVVKKGIPLRINVKAEQSAGCGSDIIFPDFNIRKIVPAGTSAVIELTPTEVGTFRFHCSMDMAKGKIIVV